jgi:hypothetical protein
MHSLRRERGGFRGYPTKGWRNLGHSVMFIQNSFIRASQMVHWWMMGRHIMGKALLVMVGWEAVPSTGYWFHQVIFSLIFLQKWSNSQVDLVRPKVDPTHLFSLIFLQQLDNSQVDLVGPKVDPTENNPFDVGKKHYKNTPVALVPHHPLSRLSVAPAK